MTVQASQTLDYNIDKNFASNFDELIDIILEPRRSDTGFSDETQMMIAPRPGTVRVGNKHDGTGGVTGQFLFTDNHGNRFHVKGFDGKVWYLKNGIWTDTGKTFSGSSFSFNTVLVPFNENHSIPTEYTTPSDASESEMVKASVSDIGGESNINKVIIITDDVPGQQTHRGIFGQITGYDAVKREYKIGGSGIISPVKSGAKYQIYDVLAEHLQVCTGASYDRYFFSDGTDLVENTKFTGLATLSLRTIGALTSTGYVAKQIEYDFRYWTWTRGMLFFSKGYTYGNPFYYSATSIYTLGTSGTVVGLFNYKGRLIVGLNNSIMSLTPSTTTDTGSRLYKRDYISTGFGMKENSFLDLGDDGYYLSSNGTAFSLAETINNTLTTTNIGKPVRYYLKSVLTKIASGYDGRYLYFYGQPDSNTAGILLVFDVWYKFWSTFSNIKPSSILFADGITYLGDNDTGTIRKFDPGTIGTDVTESGTQKIHQKVTTKDIDLGDIFSIKQVKQAYLWLENYSQTVLLDAYMGLADNASKKTTKTITVQEAVNSSGNSGILGGNQIGSQIIGGYGFDTNISLLRIKRIKFATDKAYLWKFTVKGKSDGVFYLNAMSIDIGLMMKKRRYMDAKNTI